MSENIVTIVNPPRFFSQNILETELTEIGYPKENLNIKIISKDQMTKYIELKFSFPQLADKFFNDWNGKEIFEKYKWTAQLLKGPCNQTDENINKKQYIYKKNYCKACDEDFERKQNEDGLILTNKKQLDAIKKTIGWLLKKLGETILKGGSVMNISLPVNIFDTRTMLQVFAYEIIESPFYFNLVYYLNDPLEKLKYITVQFLTTVYKSVFIIKPFNPILGETYQIKIGNLNCYLEQTEHKPPTANVYCFDDDGLYKIYGYLATTANTSVNSVLAVKKGSITVEYKDGQKYQIFYPSVLVTGTTIGKKTFNLKNNCVIKDEKNQLGVHIKFNPDKKGLISGFFSKKKNSMPDKFIGKIVKLDDIKFDKDKEKFKLDKKAKSICEITGEWTQGIKFGDTEYWNRSKSQIYNLYEMDYKLPSDSSLREDSLLWNEDKENEAQLKKEEYEEIQRKDRKLRENYNKNKK